MSKITHLETFARTGFAARGIVYLLLGYFAWTTGGGEASTTVMQRIQGMPLGTIMLFLIAFGMFGYGLFRIYGAWLDLGDKGGDAKGLFARAGPFMSGCAHLVLAVLAIMIALDVGQSGGRAGGRDVAGTAMDLPGGSMLVAAAGLIGIAAGLGNFYKAWTSGFMSELGSGAPRVARYAGWAGYAARGLVFCVIGWQILSLAFGGSQSELGTEAAMRELRSRDWLFPLVATGLAAFGLFSLIMARYARIENEDVLARLKSGLRRG